jgi:phosphoglycerate dehydrogenase-like enzyme
MKIAFLHNENAFTDELLRELRATLAQHEVLDWIAGREAPAHDLEVLVALGDIGRGQLVDQPKLALVQTASTGYEEVDIDAASEFGIWVSYAPSDLTGNATSVAEFAILLLLGASRHLGEALASLHDESVKPHRLNAALSGKTVCIVGLGSIGEQLVDRLRPFGVKIVATDEHPEHAPADVTAYPAYQLNTAVAHADFVVVCVRASKENENLINASVLGAMKRGAILVNIARGTLIDEAALVAAVKDGQIAAAGLDVLKSESPCPNDPLLKLPQVLVTPHIAGATDLMLNGTANYISLVVKEFAAGKKSKSILNSPKKPRRVLQD